MQEAHAILEASRQGVHSTAEPRLLRVCSADWLPNLQLLPRVTRRLTDDECAHLPSNKRASISSNLLFSSADEFGSFDLVLYLYGRRRRLAFVGGLTTSSGAVSWPSLPPPIFRLLGADAV